MPRVQDENLEAQGESAYTHRHYGQDLRGTLDRGGRRLYIHALILD